MAKRKIFLIGGAPLSGKSTLASELSKRLDIPWVSTDDIRKWMQAVVRKEDYPDLFYDDSPNAVTFYKKYTAQEVFRLENTQGLDVQKGIVAMIENFWQWDEFIIEGIAISPEFVRKFIDDHKDLEVVPIFLVDKDKENVKNRINKRGLWDAADTYPDYIKPIELEWTILFNNYYEKATQENGFPIHNIAELHKLEEMLSQHETK